MSEGAPSTLLLLGSEGQLGRVLSQVLPRLGVVRAPPRRALDLEDGAAIRAAVREAKPHVIVNAAAYTNVDRAEEDTYRAQRVNADAPLVLADEARRHGALLVHFSTDYVFDGESPRPYSEVDPPRPCNVYGQTKLRGDQSVLDSDAPAYIFRIGWVYGRQGRNFLNTILGLAESSERLRVVGDQFGGPSWTRSIARASTEAVALWLASQRGERVAPLRGIYHMAPPDYTSWHGFASAIVNTMSQRAACTRPVVEAISSTEYVTKAVRPRWSVLDSSLLYHNFGLRLPSWRVQLEQCMAVEGL